MKHIALTATACLMLSSQAAAFTFGEGFSSPAAGQPASIYWRAFTLYTGQESCAEGPAPERIEVSLARARIQVGDRVHRTSADDSVRADLRIEAYGGGDRLLPAVPVVVVVNPEDAATTGDTDLLASSADQDYFEALKPGQAEILVYWYCGLLKAEATSAVTGTATLTIEAAE